VFPFSKFPAATDPRPEMKSTVSDGHGPQLREAYAKAQTAASVILPTRAFASSACVSATSRCCEPRQAADRARLRDRGHPRYCGCAEQAGVQCRRANKVREGPHIVDMIKNDEINLIVNTTEGKRAIHESNSIRREAVAAA